MAARFKGNVNIRQVFARSRWNSQTGWTTTVKWEGKWSDINAAKTNTAYTLGASEIEAAQNGDQDQTGTLTVIYPAASKEEAATQFPTTQEFSNTWTFDPASEEVNVEELPKFRPLASIPGEKGYLQRILKAVETYQTEVASAISLKTADKDKVFTLGDYITLKGTASQQQHAVELADLILKGQATHPKDRYALKNVRLVPGNTSIVASHLQTQSMWSTERIVELINSTSNPITKKSIIGNISTTFAGQYWLKLAPVIREVGGDKFEIVTHFINHENGEILPEVNPKYS